MSISTVPRARLHLLLALMLGSCSQPGGESASGGSGSGESSATEGATGEPTGGTGGTGGTGESTGAVDPGEAIEAICTAMLGCTCPVPNYPSQEECVASRTMAEALVEQSAAENGLNYDPGCVSKQAEKIAALGCSNVYPESTQECAAQCWPVYGDKQIGEGCAPYEYGSSCAQGLRCSFQYVCVVGCDGQPGDPCEYFDQCLKGLYCRFTDAGVCTPYLKAGDACSDADVHLCGEGLYCDDVKLVCEAFGAVGDACGGGPGERKCAKDSYCDEVQLECLPLPQANEPCAGGFQCASGFYCRSDENGSECRAETAVGGVCQVDSAHCVEGSECVDNVCTVDPPAVCF